MLFRRQLFRINGLRVGHAVAETVLVLLVIVLLLRRALLVVVTTAAATAPAAAAATAATAAAQQRLASLERENAALRAQAAAAVAAATAAAEAAAEAARAMGLNAYILSDEIEGESREVGKMHAALARAAAKGLGPFIKPCVILSGGETTVTVRPQAPDTPRGKGGRAGEFCLGLALALQGQKGVWGLAADTDGIDGTQDNAGGYLHASWVPQAEAVGSSRPG